MTATVHPAAKSDIPAVAAVLADAFSDDPVMEWVCPDEGRRGWALSRMFAIEARFHSVPHGTADLATGTGGVAGGAALWAPPGAWKPSTWQSLCMMPGLIAALGRRVRTGMRVGAALDAVHPAEPHWYLSAIGTGSQARGGGYGSALLQLRLEHCDATSAPAYLESSKEANIGYYERFGFEVTGEIVVPDGGPTLWAMWRTPR